MKSIQQLLLAKGYNELADTLFYQKQKENFYSIEGRICIRNADYSLSLAKYPRYTLDEIVNKKPTVYGVTQVITDENPLEELERKLQPDVEENQTVLGLKSAAQGCRKVQVSFMNQLVFGKAGSQLSEPDA